LNRTHLFTYTLHLADNALMMAQRNSEWTGHGPVLEQDIAITNIALDYLGQSRNFFQYAASLYNGFSQEEKQQADKYIPRAWKTYHRELQEDDLAFLRDEQQYLNLLLTELPKGDWAQTILRQFFMSAFQYLQYGALEKSSDTQLAAIAEKSIKEVAYHLRWSSEWVIRLGDGTEESHDRMQKAMSGLWMFTGELFEPAPYELEAVTNGWGTSCRQWKEEWMNKIRTVLSEATITLEEGEKTGTQTGGKLGLHTEYLGYLLAEMQYLQKTYPNATW
jgi:ring-1,2-phenylacetyl-CoA epoxidase subunit PaaC